VYGYVSFAAARDELAGWLDDLAWTSGDGPRALFYAAVAWLPRGSGRWRLRRRGRPWVRAMIRRAGGRPSRCRAARRASDVGASARSRVG
jgi:hypothetical protein